MEHKIINTENYLLIVDDSEIKEGEWSLNKETNDVYNRLLSGYEHKIIAHLPLNNSPILEGVNLLPPIEDEVEKLAKQEAEKLHDKSKHDDWDIYNQLVYEDSEMIKIGYNKAKEKYKYTEEDILKAWNAAYIDALAIDEINYKPLFFENFIQSLQQPKMPVGFECEMENCDKCVYVQGGNLSPDCCNQLKPKTITNSQGHTQLVGEYIY